MNKLILLLAILSLMISCRKKEIKKSKNYYNIEDIKIDLKAEDYKKHLESDSIILQAEKYNAVTQMMINEKETDNGKKFVWKQYNFLNAEKEQSVGYLFEIKLRKLNFITYENLLVGVTGSTLCRDSTVIIKTINYLTNKYGKAIDLAYHGKSVINKDLLYYWQNEKKIIGISYLYHEGDYFTKEDFDSKKPTYFPVYEVYVLNKDAIDKLKKENIKLEDFFLGETRELDIHGLDGILKNMEWKEQYPNLE